ncbi:hypothetical protein PJE062_4795 [Pseudovibrio sp. JE062]|nr:hypothetical protein PJE062_4795 [Pseudovibrio sp. JE062]
MWGWLPLAIGLLIGAVVSIMGGLSGIVIALVVIVVSVIVTDKWHSTEVFLNVEEAIERKFHIKD